MSSKGKQVYDKDEDELRKENDLKQKKEEERRKKREELKELSERQKIQKQNAEEATSKMRKKKEKGMWSYYLVFGILGALCLYVIIMLFLNQTPPLNKVITIDEKKIEEHNNNSPWKQGPNKFFEGTTLADAKKLVNVAFASHSNLPRCSVDDTITPPESFDSRTQWQTCMSNSANQQKKCGGGYAIAVAQTLAERMCIASKAHNLLQLSAQELLSCEVQNQGCKGGYLNNSLDYTRNKGLVEESCFPYEADSETVKCDKKCGDKPPHRSNGYCLLVGEEDIKRNIYKNGPALSTSHIYVDMLTYKSGVYSKSEEIPRFSGFQAVKIVGWGVESGSENEPNQGNKYWIVQNTWGSDWGEDGFAKISFGQEMMFDQYAYSINIQTEQPKAAPKPAETAQPKKRTRKC